MPRHSTREGRYLNNPVLEILADGQPWGAAFPHDDHFRFGLNKAGMILWSMGLIEEFVSSRGMRPQHDVGIPVAISAWGMACTCTIRPKFQRGGIIVPQPYMELVSGSTKIGFGLRKADALISVRRDIEEFLERYGHLDQ